MRQNNNRVFLRVVTRQREVQDSNNGLRLQLKNLIIVVRGDRCIDPKL